MIRTLIANALFAGAAYQQASLCADAARHSFALGVLMLFFCHLGNQLVAAWWKGEP